MPRIDQFGTALGRLHAHRNHASDPSRADLIEIPLDLAELLTTRRLMQATEEQNQREPAVTPDPSERSSVEPPVVNGSDRFGLWELGISLTPATTVRKGRMFQGLLPERCQAAFGQCRPSLAGRWSLGGQAAEAATHSAQTEDRDQWVRNMSSILTL